MQIAAGGDVEVEQAMAPEGGQHVVEKADAGGNAGFPGAIEVEAEFYIGFGGFAGNLGTTGHALAVAHSPRREKPSTWRDGDRPYAGR
jgi:hypothetical protein